MFTGQADSLIIGSDIGHRARARNLNIHERGRCGPANPVEWLQPAGTTPIVIQPWDEKKLMIVSGDHKSTTEGLRRIGNSQMAGAETANRHMTINREKAPQ